MLLKKGLYSVLSVALIAGSCFSVVASAKTADDSKSYNVEKTEKQKKDKKDKKEKTDIEKFYEIADKYELNEPITDEEDLRLIKTYGQVPASLPTVPSPVPGQAPPPPPPAFQNDYWSISGYKNAGFLTANVYGNIYIGLGMIWNNSMNGTITTNVTYGSPTLFRTGLRFVGYGIIGTSGTYVGKTADFDLSSGDNRTTNKTHTWSFDHYFNGTIAFYQVYPKATVMTNSGSVDIGLSANKQ